MSSEEKKEIARHDLSKKSKNTEIKSDSTFCPYVAARQNLIFYKFRNRAFKTLRTAQLKSRKNQNLEF